MKIHEEVCIICRKQYRYASSEKIQKLVITLRTLGYTRGSYAHKTCILETELPQPPRGNRVNP